MNSFGGRRYSPGASGPPMQGGETPFLAGLLCPPSPWTFT